MRFPYREADILRLANDIATGLAAHPEVFPAPPYSPEDFRAVLGEHEGRRESFIAAHASAGQSTDAKDETQSKIQDMSKTVIRYAENITGGDHDKLQLIGWGGRRARTPMVLEPPAQVRTLEVVREGKDWVFLDWKEPLEGGEIAAYRVQRRKREGGGDWVDVGMSVESDVTLNGQEIGVEYEYRVIAVNRAGEGPASNIVRAVL